MQSCLEVVDRQSQHMTRLVNDLLDVTRVTHDLLRLHRTPVDIIQCIDNVITAMEPQFHAAGLELIRDVPEAPVYVDADPERLSQIFGNLLHNAANFTPPQGSVAVRIVRAHRQAKVIVRDTGIGMAPEDIESLFDPYRRPKSGALQSTGLGLGLTLAKRLIDLHGGTIRARSEGVGRGAEFEITMPLAATLPGERVREPETAAPTTRRILIVDDDADVGYAFGGFLESIGHEVRTLVDSELAVDAARSFRPDVAFLDLSMPKIDGYELAQRLRAALPHDRLILVALSGYDRKARTASDGQDRFDHHLLKPATPQAVKELLENIPPAAAPSGE